MTTLLKDTFRAGKDQTASLSPKFVVTGEVEVAASGWNVTLLRKEPQGFNPADLLLEIRTEKPYGARNPVRDGVRSSQTIPVRYEETPPKNDYKQVTIFNGRDSITIDVQV